MPRLDKVSVTIFLVKTICQLYQGVPSDLENKPFILSLITFSTLKKKKINVSAIAVSFRARY